jgi:hypothetical protein
MSRHTAVAVVILAWPLSLVLGWWVAAAGAGAQLATANTENEPLSGVAALVQLPGECGAGGPLEPGWSVDCRFVIRAGAADSIDYAELLDDRQSFTQCRVEDGGVERSVLRCPNLLADRFDQGTVSFTLNINQWSQEAAAVVTTTWASAQPFDLYSLGVSELVVFDERPLRWFSYFYEPVDGLFISVRSRDGGEVLQTLPVPVEEPFVSAEGSVTLELPVGRYRWWPCLGPTPETCVEQPGGQPLQVIDGEPLELIDGHNRQTAERINILFVGSGLADADGATIPALPDLARQLLTIGQPTGVDVEGRVVPAGEPADRLMWGPMATEPLRSNLDRFNFWYLEDDLGDETSLLGGGWDEENDLGFDLPNLQITALYNSDQRFASDARGASFESFEPDEIGPRGRLRFGDARVWISPYDPLSSAPTLTHEWGHGLFGLRDEYYGFDGRGIATGFPNCAPDQETGALWWGDLLGEVDPFVEEVLEIEGRRLREPPDRDGLLDRVRIEVTAGGCYSDFGSTQVFRPSRDSMMNSEIPVFGAVNRARVDEVLARFSGRGPMGSLDDMTLECEGLLGRINCTGELRSHLDRPLSIVAIDSIPCEIGRGRPQADGSIGPVPVSCTTVGSPVEPVDLTFKTERRSVEVVDVNPPTPPVPMESRLIPLEGGADVDASAGDTVWVGGLLIMATVALAFVEHRRRAAAS